MKLEGIQIRKKWNGEGYTGTIKYELDEGNIELNLTEDQIRPILDVVASALVDVSKTVANNLTHSIITHSNNLLEHEDAT